MTATNETMERAALESLVRAFLREPTDDEIRDIRKFLGGIPEPDSETMAILSLCWQWDDAAAFGDPDQCESVGTAVRWWFSLWLGDPEFPTA